MDSSGGAEAGHADVVPELDPLVVVGIGASAGGLEALGRFFSGLPADPAAAFVVVQHLSPDHKSMMVDLLARNTVLPVRIAEHDLPIEPDHVYVIPPGMTMGVSHRRLQLRPKPAHGLSLPIDDFFEDLARDLGTHAIGIVLSGTGSDGSRGIEAIHEAGGVVLVQRPDTAKFDGMPQSAIARGMADDILAPEDLAKEVLRRVHLGPGSGGLRDTPAGASLRSDALEAAVQVLRASGGIDFDDYKPNMLMRRIERRQIALGLRDLPAYVEHLSGSAEEQSDLRRELLIPVTRFFRDPDAFASLRTRVIEPLVHQRRDTGVLRVWCAAVASGEEAYSVAMVLADTIAASQAPLSFKMFATDVEGQYVERAGLGRYPSSIAPDVPPELLERHFTRVGDQWQVRPELRQRIVFARHNLLSDAPFTQMDLVVCRNMLIYLRGDAQERALRRLQFALRPGGVLFLGPSESLANMASEFAVVDGRQKLFRLVAKPPMLPAADLLPEGRLAGPRDSRRERARSMSSEPQAVDLAWRALADSYGPPSLLMTQTRELMHVFGDARRLLEFQSGEATLDVLRLLPRPLQAAVAALTYSVARERVPQRSQAIEVELPSGTERLCVVVRALVPLGKDSPLLVSFEPAEPQPAPQDGVVRDLAAIERAELEALERELASTRAGLESSVQELATANEEFQATNEELMAANEELQSTNEELQSVNEELHTVNAEYQAKIDELNVANADLEGLTRATRVPTLFVDESLGLVRFTPDAVRLFRLREGDLGRPIDDLAHQLDYPDLYQDLRVALEQGRTSSREVRDTDGRHHLATVMPYVEVGLRQKRAVVTFVDVTLLKDARRLQTVLDALPNQLAVLDRDGTIVLVNRAWRDFAQANGDIGLQLTGPGQSYLAACRTAAPPDPDAERAQRGLEGVLSGRAHGFSMQYPCHSPTERRWFLMHASPLPTADGGCIVTHTNITGWVLAEQTRAGAGAAP